MKRIYLLLLITIIPTTLFCQQNMLLDSIIHFGWNKESSDFVESGQRYYTYDDSGNLVEKFHYGDSWGSDWLWADGTRFVYTYDASGNLIEETTFYWLDGSWKKTQKGCTLGCVGGQKIYSYDSQDNITLFLWNSWNDDFNIWEVVDSIIYTYDGNGFLISEVLYAIPELDINEWFVHDSTFYTYDANGNLTERSNYSWDRDHNNWRVRDPTVYAYDANGNLTEEIRYDWETNKWFRRYDYTYDANGNLTEKIWRSNWGYCNDDERWIYVYDPNGNLTEEIGYYCESYEWLLGDSTLYAYDANGNLIEEMVGTNWDSETNDWRYLSKNVSYWSELNTQTYTSTEQHQCIIYPNPAYNLITIETEYPDHYSINITSLNGQQLFAGEMEGTTHRIDLTSFQSGVYFITIRSKDFVTTKKIIKL